MSDCRLTLQESRRAAEWVLEAAGREGKGPREFLEEKDIRRIMNAREAPRQKAQRLFSLLRKRRFPLLESWKARFASACSQMGIQEKGIQISHDPTFETTQINVHVQAESEPELGNGSKSCPRQPEGERSRNFSRHSPRNRTRPPGKRNGNEESERVPQLRDIECERVPFRVAKDVSVSIASSEIEDRP
jgi:hypothetical protein